MGDVSEPGFIRDVSNRVNPDHTFYLGPANTGAPLHFHDSAWNLVVFGMKRWFAFPPHHSWYSQAHPLQVDRNTLAEAQTCVQRAGDLVLIPASWAHATINLVDTIGLSNEFVLR